MLERMLRQYRADHRHPINRATHWVGIPCLLVAVPLLWLRPWWGLGLFTLGLVLQLLGHAFEGKAPSFLRDPRYVLVGAMWFARGLLGGERRGARTPERDRTSRAEGPSMRAARIHAYGGPDVFEVDEVPCPRPGPHDVVVAVRAAGVNPVDFKIRQGSQRALGRRSLPAILGLDLSGVVVEVGERVTRFAPGDEVFGSPTHRRAGTYAERVAVHERELARKPARLSHVEAASLPLVGLTAWQCLVSTARLAPGDRVLVQAGAGGVGTFAIQLAKHLGARVATTCSAGNAELVRRLGADEVIDHRRERFEDRLRDYDVVLESLGSEHLIRARRVLRRGGRLVYISSGLPESVARHGAVAGVARTVGRILAFGVGSLLRGVRAHFVVRRPDGEQLERIAELVDAGAIRPVVARTFRLDEVAEAHRALETGRTRGKLVIDLTA